VSDVDPADARNVSAVLATWEAHSRGGFKEAILGYIEVFGLDTP
jgi:hypothetical protein